MLLAAHFNVQPAKNTRLMNNPGNFAGVQIDANGIFFVAIDNGRDACAAAAADPYRPVRAVQR